MEFVNLIPYSIPLGVFLIATEVFISVRYDEHLYDWKDSAASAVMGLVATLLGIVTKAATLGFFYIFYELFKSLRIECFGYESLGWAWWVWALAILGDDHNFYWHHRFSHTIRVLWAAHVVHHSSERFNLGTSFRNGWVIFFYKPILWIWMPAIGFHPVMVLTAISINSMYQFFLHSKKVPHLGILEEIFNTPQLRQLHHSSNVAFLDKNHGGILIWDKLFGTYLDSRKYSEERKFGVLTPLNSYNPMVIFAHEYNNIWKDIKNAPTFIDKLKYIFYPPGWSHDNSRLTAKQMQRLAEQEKLQLRSQPKLVAEPVEKVV